MSTAKILIVDSDPAAALVTQHGLQRLQPGTEVTTAISASAAWLSCLHDSVDLLIIDPNPANSVSSALIKALRTDRPDTDVLVLTAYDTPRLRTPTIGIGLFSSCNEGSISTLRADPSPLRISAFHRVNLFIRYLALSVRGG